MLNVCEEVCVFGTIHVIQSEMMRKITLENIFSNKYETRYNQIIRRRIVFIFKYVEAQLFKNNYKIDLNRRKCYLNDRFSDILFERFLRCRYGDYFCMAMFGSAWWLRRLYE